MKRVNTVGRWHPKICGTCLLICSLLAAPTEAAEITLKPHAASPGSLVLLGDIATVAGNDEKAVATLRRLELFPAPTGGASRILRRKEIRELIALNGIDAGRHRFAGAERTHVTRQVRRTTRPPALQPAPTPLPLQPVVVLTRPLARGQVVTAADLSLQQLPGEVLVAKRVVTALDDALGMALTRSLKAGQQLETTMLSKPVLVRANELITVISRAPGVRVQLVAKATQQGAQGDLILVRPLQGGDKYTAVVSGPKQAEVFASGVSVPRAEVATRPLSTRTIQ